MESSKEKAKSLKSIARQFGYEIKLTHAQEILAQLNGFKNRHAFFKNEDNFKVNKNQDKFYNTINLLKAYHPQLNSDKFVENLKNRCLDLYVNTGNEQSDYENFRDGIESEIQKIVNNTVFYYEVHVFYNRKNGASFFFQSDIKLETEEDIINYAIEHNIVDEDDCNSIDYTQEVSQEEYESATNIKKDKK